MMLLLKNQMTTAGYVLRYCWGLPHWAQNLVPADSSAPQPEHLAGDREVPHFWQKRASLALALPHLGQGLPALPPP
jgi:hypothetical protein